MTRLTVEFVTASNPDVRDKIAACEPVHRQLRPDVQQPFVDLVVGLLSDGAQLAIGREEQQIRCLALFRVFGTTLGGRRLYIDDLVTDANHRGRSFGTDLLSAVEDEARSQGCIMATLESGLERSAAHRFYFGSGYAITAFSFEKTL